MKKTITIKNDASFVNGDGVVHTWLVLNNGEGKIKSFGFTPKKESGYFNVEGELDKEKYLETRNYSQSLTIEISVDQYDKIIKSIDIFSKNLPMYDLIPDGNGGDDFNCTTAADYILKSAGIHILDGVQSPFGVAGRIDSMAFAHISTYDDLSIVDNTSAFNTFESAINTSVGIIDFGPVESILDAKDAIDYIAAEVYNYSEQVFSAIDGTVSEAAQAFKYSFLEATQLWLDASVLNMNTAVDALEQFGESSSSWISELLGYFSGSMGAFASGMANLANGGTIPLSAAGSLPFPPGAMFPGMMFPGFAPPGFGPSMDGAQRAPADPIIIDLDGDGIETLSINKNIFFDHDGNKFAENTGWVGEDDGLLVMDLDGNGLIDTGKELFGDNTVLQDGKKASNGFDALKDKDSNGDGVINSQDMAWEKLQVWQDKNSNARVDEGELHSLDSLGIAAINTKYKNSTLIDEQGNAHRQTGSVIFRDGKTSTISDVWFDHDNGYSHYIGDVDVSDAIRELPFIRGFGNLADLHIAMSKDNSLQILIEQYSANPELARASGLIDNILFCWAGVTDLDTSSRGININARVLAVLEAATGDGFVSVHGKVTDPNLNAAKLIEEEYTKFSSYIESQLLAQTLYADEFAYIRFGLNSDMSGFILDFTDLNVHLNEIKNDDAINYLRLSDTIYSWLEYMPSYRNECDISFSMSDTRFIGGKGNDNLIGTSADDFVWGKRGNDHLDGRAGSDTYLFSQGDGQDQLSDSATSSVNTLAFEGADIAKAVLEKSGNDLLIRAWGGSDTLTLSNYFISESYRQFDMVFGDTTLTVSDLAAMGFPVYGNDSVNSLSGWDHDDTVLGFGGNDSLNGGKGNDVLDGGAGNDALNGGSGNDTYIFRAGDGQDRISDKATSSVNTLVFEGADIAKAVLEKSGNDLLIRAWGGSDTLTLSNYFISETYRQFDMVFGDTTLTVSDLAVMGFPVYGNDSVNTLSGWDNDDTVLGFGGNDTLNGGKGNDSLDGGTGDDTLNGGSGNDILDGGTGNDSLSGGEGSDAYIFRIGDGQDRVNDTYKNGVNTLVFEGADIAKAVLEKSGNDLLIRAWGGSDTLTLSNYFISESYRQFDMVFGDTTLTVCDLAAMGFPVYGNDSVNSLIGWDNDDTLLGFGGNDTLNGGKGNDVLDGGAGNDALNGGSGNDTYILRAGDGQDRISDKATSSVNTLVFEGSDIAKAVLEKSGNDLLIRAWGGSDTLTLSNYFISESYRQFDMVFGDTTLTVSDLAGMGFPVYGNDSVNTLSGWDNDDTVLGYGGNDTLNGGKGNDSLDGGTGDDTLNGGSGNDILDGGTGNDSLSGGEGSDAYIFRIGDGQDRVNDTYKNGVNTLVFEGADITQAMIEKSGNDLLIRAWGGSDTLTLSNYFISESYRQFDMVFGDTTLTVSDLAAMGFPVYGNDSVNSLSGWDNDDSLLGLGGNDTLNGGKGNDSLDGGTGNDSLSGGEGSDAYIFRIGDGQDRVNDTYKNGVNTLVFEGSDIAKAVLEKSGNDLLIRAWGGSDTLTLSNYFISESYRQFDMVFGDTTLTVSDLAAMGFPVYGNDSVNTLSGWDNDDSLLGFGGNDTLNGGKGNDSLDGGTGNDSLSGGAGSDTYIFRAGDGKDNIYEHGSVVDSSDTILFNEDILASETRVSRKSNNLVLSFAERDDSMTISNFFVSSDYQVEHIMFADGTDWIPEDILNHIEDSIPLPLAETSDNPFSLSFMQQQVCQFTSDSANDEGMDSVSYSLASARTTTSALSQ